MKATDLLTGLRGHPTRPPLLYTGAAAFAVLSALGVAEDGRADDGGSERRARKERDGLTHY